MSDTITIKKVQNDKITTKWKAYRVEMKNDKHRKWTLIMCNLVKQFNDRSYVTQHPKGTVGSLFKEDDGEVVAHGTIAYLINKK